LKNALPIWWSGFNLTVAARDFALKEFPFGCCLISHLDSCKADG
jgi:hypothetical protein